MVVCSKCTEPRLEKTDARSQFAFLVRSAAGRQIAAEDELEQLDIQVRWRRGRHRLKRQGRHPTLIVSAKIRER